GVMAVLIQREADPLHLRVSLRPNKRFALRVIDRLVVLPLRRLRGWREERLRQPVRLAQALGQAVPADLAGLLVRGPATANEITAHDALDRERRKLADNHAPR